MMMDDAVQLYGARGLYLRGMSDSALSERLVHWMNNCMQLSSEGKISLCATENPDHFQRLTDVLAETALRSGDVSKAQDSAMWRPDRNVMITPSEETSAKISQLQSFISNRTVAPLIRVGGRKYMRELYESGGLLFQDASSFSQSENLSVRDDELTLLMKRYIPRDELSLVPGAPDPLSFKEGGWGMNFSLSCPDFLVLCMTDRINLRLISDWNAESAVVIHDPNEFTRRLRIGTIDMIEKSGCQRLECGRLRYIDPYFPLEKPDVPFCKHYRFAYQREFRFIARGNRKLDFSDRKITMGSLKDVAHLVEFNA